MNRLIAIATLVAALLLAAMPANAQTFGDQEKLTKIQDVEIVGAENEPLSLGFKTTTKNFLLPYTISDDGYVLVVRNDSERFYTMSAEEIAGWQTSGLLPDPLPPYEVPLIDRILGYVLWPTLVVIVGIWFIQWRNSQKKKAAAAAAAPPPDQAA